MIYKCSQYEQLKKIIIGYNEYRDTRLQLPIKYNILQYKKAKDKGEFIEEKIVPIKEEDIRTGTCRRIYRFRGGGCREVIGVTINPQKNTLIDRFGTQVLSNI